MDKETEALIKELEGCPCEGLVDLAKDYLDALHEWSPDVQGQGRAILYKAVEELKNSLFFWKVTATRLEDGEELEFLYKSEESANDHWKRLSEDPSISFAGMLRKTLLP